MEPSLKSTQPQTGPKNTLVKSALLLMLLTIFSKVFGFAREVTQAYFFGADMATDAYLVALTIPTIIFGGVSGAINNVFIPVFDRFRTLNRDKALVWKFTQVGLILTAVIFIVPVFINTSWAVRLFAPAFSAEAIALAAGMLRILVFLVFFQFLSSIMTAVLHVDRNFLVPGMLGFPYSLAIIAFSFLFAGRIGIDALVWGTFFGIGLQVFVQLPWFMRTKFGGSLNAKASDGLKEIAFLLPPILVGTFAGQAKAMIDRIFASGLAEGSISSLNYALRVKDLPVGILVATVVTVLYPTLVTHANKKEWLEYRTNLANSLSTMTFLMLPMLAGFAVLAVPITQLVYERGNFDNAAVISTAHALRMYSPGLIGSMLHRLFIKGLYAIKDTRTPLIAMFISVPINVILNFAFIPFLGHGGLALATSLAVIIGALYMYSVLVKTTGPLVDRDTAIDIGKAIAAAAVMALFCFVAYTVVLPYIPAGFFGRAVYIGAIIGLSAVLYFALAHFLKISAMKQAIEMAVQLKNRFRPAA